MALEPNPRIRWYVDTNPPFDRYLEQLWVDPLSGVNAWIEVPVVMDGDTKEF